MIPDNNMDRRLGSLSLFLICLCVSFRPIGSGMTMELGSNLIVYILVFFCAILWVVRAALKEEITCRSGWVMASALAFILMCVFWTAAAQRKMPAVMTLIPWMVDILLFSVVLQTSDRGARRTVMSCLMASAVTVACLGVAQYFWGFDELREIIERDPDRIQRELGLSSEMWPTFIARATNREVFATFVYPNALAGFLNVIIPVTAGMLIAVTVAAKNRLSTEALKRPEIPFATAATMIMVVCLVLTRSKGGWIAAVPGVTYVLLAATCRTPMRKLAAAAGCLGLLLLLLIFGSLGDRPVLAQMADSFRVRIGYWETASRIMSDNTFIKGVGLRGFADYYAMYKKPFYHEVRLAHSTVFQLLVDMGIFGAASYCMFWFFVIKDAAVRRPEEEETEGYRWTGIAAGLGAFLLLAVTLDISPFTTDTGGTNLSEWFAYMMLWVVSYLAMERLSVLESPAVRAGLVGGCVGYLVHGLIDFDMFVPGVHQAALLSAACASGASFRTRDFTGLYKFSVLAVALVFTAFVALWLRGMVPFPDIIQGESLEKTGRHHMAEKRNEEAIENFELSVAVNPLNDEVAGILSSAYFGMYEHNVRRYRGKDTLMLAEQAAEAAVKANPLSSSHRIHLARITMAYDRNKALAHAEEGVRLYPAKPANHLFLADILMSLGRENEARGEYAEALRLNGMVNEPWLKLKEEDIRRASGDEQK